MVVSPLAGGWLEGYSLGAQPWDPAATGRVWGCVLGQARRPIGQLAWPTFRLFFRAPLPPRLLACAQAGVPVSLRVPGDGRVTRGSGGSHFYQVSSVAAAGVHGYLGAPGAVKCCGALRRLSWFWWGERGGSGLPARPSWTNHSAPRCHVAVHFQVANTKRFSCQFIFFSRPPPFL